MATKSENIDVLRPGKYVGQTLNQVRHGQGKYVYDNTFFTYDGSWVEGSKHGKGLLSMKDGGYYKGDFANGEITGKGERSWASGSIYVGEFDRGELSGKGEMKYSDGRRYTGQWCDNVYEGKGTLHSGNGDIYSGHFHQHKRHGEGNQVWADGQSYEGGWVSDKPHGHGAMKYSDGSVYEGQFYHGLRKGEGTYTHVTGITYNGIWIQDEIPPEEFATGIAFVGSTEVEINHGESFSIEIAVLHTDGNVMEGDTGRTLDVQVGLLSALPGDKSSKLKSDMSVGDAGGGGGGGSGSFDTPFGEVRLASLAEVTKKDTRWEEYEETHDTTSTGREKDQRPASRSGFEYIKLPTPAATSPKRSSQCGHASWVNVVIPAHEMMEALESEEEEGDLTEEAKPKAKKKGKNSPAASRKDRSATPDDKEKWKREGPRAERDKDLLKYAAPGMYVIKVEDVTEPKFFGRSLDPIYMKLNVMRVKKSSTKYLIPKSTNPTPAPSKKSEK